MPVPDQLFDSEGIAPIERFDAYREFMSGGYTEIRPASNWRLPGTISTRCWRIGRVSVWHHRHSGLRMRRPASSALAQRNDVLVVSTYLEGRSEGQFGNVPFSCRTGSVALTDLRHSVDARSIGPVEMFLVEFPFELVGYRPVGRRLGHWDLQGIEKRLVAANLDVLLRELPDSTPAEALILLSALAGVVRSVVQPMHSEYAARISASGRAEAMRAFVEENLCRSGLRAVDVGAALGASRATVYREFASEGGFDRYVLRRRLTLALEELRGSAPRRGLIGEVASRWGFPDAACFSRSVRQIVGTAPSDVVGLEMKHDQTIDLSATN